MSEENIEPNKGGRPKRDPDEKTLAAICNDLVIKVPLTPACKRAGVDIDTVKRWIAENPEIGERIDKAKSEGIVFYAQGIARSVKPHEKTITKRVTKTEFRYEEGYDEQGRKYRRPVQFETTYEETIIATDPGDGDLALKVLERTNPDEFGKRVDITSGGLPMQPISFQVMPPHGFGDSDDLSEDDNEDGAGAAGEDG